MQFCTLKHALIACSRAAALLMLALAAIFALETQAAFGEQASTQSSYGSSYGSSTPLPPLIAAPRPPALPSLHSSAMGNRHGASISAVAVKPVATRPVVALAPTPAQPAEPTPPATEHSPNQATAAHSASPAAPAALAGARPEHPAAVDIPINAAEQPVYRIGVDDVLNISVWQEPDLSRTVPVRPDGKISLPLVGDITAAGKSAMQLQGELKLEMAKFVRNPELTVIVVDIRSRRVNVMGQVAKPGTFPLTQSMSVLEALALAGGLRDFAKKKDIYVLRTTPDGKRERIPYPYDAILKGKTGSKEIMLQPRDTVVVP